MRLRVGILSSQINDTSFGWRQFGTSSNDQINGIVADNSGNIYMVGTTNGTLSGNTSSGLTDIFLSKYAIDGKPLWTKQIGSSGNDQGTCIAYDVDNDYVYIGGIAGGSIGGETFSGGTSDGFIAKYNSSGTLLFIKLVGSSGEDGILAISYYNNNIYAGGYASGSIDGQTYGGNFDSLLIKYNSSGTRIWTRLSGQAGNDKITGVTLNEYWGTIGVCGQSTGTFFGNSSPGGIDAYVSVYDTLGTRQGTNLLGSTSSDDYAYDIIHDSYYLGDFYVCGETSGAMGTKVGLIDGFIAKCDGRIGVRSTLLQFGNSGQDTSARSLCFNYSYLELICTGYTTGAFPGYTNSGGKDIFISSFSTPSISLLLNKQYGSSGDDISNSITSDLNFIYIGGSTTGSLNGTNFGGTDAFIGKFNQGTLDS